MTLPVETNRLILRRLVVTDLDDLLAYRAHPEVLRYLPEKPITCDAAITYLTQQATEEPGDAGGYFALAVQLKHEAKMIGEVGIYIHPKEQSCGDIGWIIHPDRQRQGFATEAAKAMLAFGFSTRKLHRITSGCDAPNIASLRIMERLGMRREAHYRQSRFAAGVWHDTYAYALLRDEWFPPA